MENCWMTHPYSRPCSSVMLAHVTSHHPAWKPFCILSTDFNGKRHVCVPSSPENSSYRPLVAGYNKGMKIW